MEATHVQEYRVRDLPTRSITLFPTRAQVVRDIRNVTLKPGLNQISVVGLTPTVDQHSIKVEGTGSAVISDISVELLENTDIFEEIYPASDEDDSDESDDDDGRDASTKDSDDEALTSAKTEMKAVDEKIVALHDEIKREDEVISSAEKRLVLLEEYGKKFEPKSGADVGEIVDVYDAQRRKTFHDHMEATVRRRKLNAEVLDLQKKRNKLHAQVQKEDKKHVKAALKEAEAKRKKIQLLMARLQKKQNEEKRIHNERCKFWPRSCYTVRITLDATHYTPVSSRRSSVSSVTDLVKPVVDEPTDPASPGTNGPSSACDISLSYVTSAAFWSPSYDLQLNTTANTGTLFFDAQLSNNTSETWKDCKIILSTSQAVFAGLQDNIPSLVPWRIKLAGRVGGVHAGDITNSTEEVEQRRKSQNTSTSTSQDRHGANLIGTTKAIVRSKYQVDNVAMSRSAISNPFGAPSFGEDHDQARLLDYQQQLLMLEQQNKHRRMMAHQQSPQLQAQQQAQQKQRLQELQQQQRKMMQQQQQQQPQSSQFMHLMQAPQQRPEPPATGGLFGSNNGAGFGSSTGGGLFGSASSSANPPPQAAASAFGQRASSIAGPPPQSFSMDKQELGLDFANPVGTKDVLADFDFDSFLDFQESAVEETGMTTTYDLPGTKTLAPSSNASKQRVARIAFTNVAFSHTVVAKYRPAAFLKARLRNASKLSLLRGPVGLTLDGTFMGRSTLPRCSSGDSFTMSLGVDPTIRVIYPKPDVKRSSSGVFSKENSTGYRRSVTITNTRGASSSSTSSSKTGKDSATTKPVRLIVLDQVPVSEDDKLRVDIAYPRGLSEGGGGVITGAQQAAPKDVGGGSGGKDWGKAVATLKKSGEVSWDVELHAGKSVKFDLEYEVALPAGDVAVQSSDTSKW